MHAALHRVLSCGATLVLLSCSSGQRRAAAPDSTDETTRVVTWALGEGTRSGTLTSPETYLLLLPRGQSPPATRPATADCTSASSILPAPAGSARVFSAVRGRLHVRASVGTAEKPVDGTDAALSINDLLAFETASSPLKLLVLAQPAGEDVSSLWSIEVNDTGATGQSRLKDAGAFRESERFFSKYTAPRCQQGNASCLVIQSVDGQWYVDIEATRNGNRTPFLSLGAKATLDAAWQPGGTSVYLLLKCR